MFFGGGQSGFGSFDSKFTFHFGERCHDVKEEPSRGRAGIDGVRQAFEPDLLGLQLADELDKVFDGAAEPIKFPYDERVSLAEEFECFGESGRSNRFPENLSSRIFLQPAFFNAAS